PHSPPASPPTSPTPPTTPSAPRSRSEAGNTRQDTPRSQTPSTTPPPPPSSTASALPACSPPASAPPAPSPPWCYCQPTRRPPPTNRASRQDRLSPRRAPLTGALERSALLSAKSSCAGPTLTGLQTKEKGEHDASLRRGRERRDWVHGSSGRSLQRRASPSAPPPQAASGCRPIVASAVAASTATANMAPPTESAPLSAPVGLATMSATVR